MGMLDRAFDVAIVFSAVDHVTRPMQQMAGQMGVLDQRSQQLQQRMNQFRNMSFAGGAFTMAGAALVGQIEQGLDVAGKFLTQLTIIKDVVGATADEMDRIKTVIRDSSLPSMFGIMDTAAFAKKLASSGMSSEQIQQTLPVFTQYAEVQKMGKGTAPEEAITQAVGAAHMIGAYTPKETLDFLDKYNKATFMQPGSSSEFADTFKYLAPSGAALGMKTDDILTLSALANRVGLAGSMGGTNAADMILRSIPGLLGGKIGTKKDTKQVHSLKELGLYDTIFDDKGEFKGVENFVTQLQKASKGRSPKDLALHYHHIFGMQGMRLAQILSSERGQEQLHAITQNMEQMKSISEMQDDINATPEGQILQLEEGISNLQLTTWIELAKILLPIIRGANQLVAKITAFTDAHPRVAKMVALFILFSTAALLIIGPMLLLVGALGYLSTSGMIGAGFALLGFALKGLLGPMAFVASASYLLYQAWKTNYGGIREKTAAAYEWIKKETPVVIEWIHKLLRALGIETKQMSLIDPHSLEEITSYRVPEWLKTMMKLIVAGKTFNFVAGGALKLFPMIFGAGSLRTVLRGAVLGALKGITGIGKILFGARTVALAKGMFSALRTFGSLAFIAMKIAGQFGLKLLMLGAHALIAGARMAAAWIIGMGPIGWAIMGIVALVAFLVLAWKNNWGHIREHTANVVQWIKEHFEAMIEWFKLLPGKMKEFGVNIVTGLWEGISNLGGWLKDKVSGWIKDVLPDVIKEKLGISSPSRLMKQYGRYTAQGLALGIQAKAGMVKDAAGQMIGGAVAQTKGIIGTIKEKVGTGIKGLSSLAMPQMTPTMQTGQMQAAFGTTMNDLSRTEMGIMPTIAAMPNMSVPNQAPRIVPGLQDGPLRSNFGQTINNLNGATIGINPTMRKVPEPITPDIAFGVQTPQVVPQLQTGTIGSAFSGLIEALSNASIKIKPILDKMPKFSIPDIEMAIRQQIQTLVARTSNEDDQYSDVPALGRGNGGNIDQSMTIEEGAIVVHAAPNHSVEDIAERVMVKLQRKTRNQTWSRPTPVIPGVR